jgi:phosphatidylserine/phosphatidylglycerophosphate/cardiolipin synthase-like enzyme
MVIVLDTAHCSAALSRLIKYAESEIILVSPYLQISPLLLNLLRDASSRNVEITIIYRDDKLTDRSLERLNEEKSKLDGINVNM